MVIGVERARCGEVGRAIGRRGRVEFWRGFLEFAVVVGIATKVTSILQ
jgi:hypothetical protein